MLSYFLDALFIHSFQIVGAADRGETVQTRGLELIQKKAFG